MVKISQMREALTAMKNAGDDIDEFLANPDPDMDYTFVCPYAEGDCISKTDYVTKFSMNDMLDKGGPICGKCGSDLVIKKD